MSADSRLLSFHKMCKEEYNELLEHFNLLFYGYGCKKKLLELLFPNSIVINCKFCSLHEAVGEIIRQTRVLPEKVMRVGARRQNIDAVLEKLDNAWEANGVQTRLIFLNFDFKELAPLSRARHFKVIGTIEDIAYMFCHSDIRSFNFIFRDLTTFVPYSEETVDIVLSRIANRVQSAVHIFENVPKKAQVVFIEFLRLKHASTNVCLSDIFNSLRKKLLLQARSECQVLLSEFLDHKILRIRSNEEIVTDLTCTDISALLKQLRDPLFCKK